MTQIICSFFFGYLADIYDKPKLILGYSIILSIFVFVMIFSIHGDDYNKGTKLLILHTIYGIISYPHIILLQTLVLAKLNNRIWELAYCKLYGGVFYGFINVLIGYSLDIYEDYAFLMMLGIVVKSVNVYYVCAYLPDSAKIQYKSNRKMRCDNQFFDQFIYLFGNRHNLSYLLNYGINLANMRLIDGIVVIYLRELNASYLICGLSVLLSVSLEPLVFANVKTLLNAFGIKYLLVISQALMIVRTLYYAIFNDAGYILYMEPINGIIVALSNASILSFITSQSICPKGMENSMNSLKNLVGIIPMFSYMFIGYIMETYNISYGYYTFVILQLISCLIFTFYNHNYEFPYEGQFDEYNVYDMKDDNIINQNNDISQNELIE